MGRIAYIFVIVALLLVGCASGNESSQQTSGSPAPKQETASTKLLTKEEFEQLYSDPDKFEGSKVDFYAQIFMPVERDEKGTYIQAFSDPKNHKKNTIIAIADPKIDLKENDVIHVVGTVKGKFTGTNAFGAEVTAPTIIADKIEKTDYATAFSPAKETIAVDKELNHNGFAVNLKKVELAEEETRVYLAITNKTKGKIHFFSHSAKLTQGNKQYEPELIIGDKYPQIQNEILPGITSEGVIVFPRVEGSTQLKLFLEGSSENWSVNIDPFVFEIKQ